MNDYKLELRGTFLDNFYTIQGAIYTSAIHRKL